MLTDERTVEAALLFSDSLYETEEGPFPAEEALIGTIALSS